jgi:hypothetical protein
VTASRDGVIRSFPNYGLPVRLWASQDWFELVSRAQPWLVVDNLLTLWSFSSLFFWSELLEILFVTFVRSCTSPEEMICSQSKSKHLCCL